MVNKTIPAQHNMSTEIPTANRTIVVQHTTNQIYIVSSNFKVE